MKRITFVLALLLCVVQFATAQTIKVTGTVTDDQNEPLMDASVLVKGTNTRAFTDHSGQFTLNADRNATLVISFSGFREVEVPVNGRSVIPPVKLELDASALSETIVIGYGTARKVGSVSGAVTTVQTKALKDKPVMNMGDALQGMVPGLQVYSSSGDPSASVTMRMRGVSSINASTTPLFVLDGTPVGSDILSILNPNDIESLVVLKDAASTAVYGSRAANGVVFISTKKGAGDKPTIRVSANFGISSLARNPVKMMNAEEWYAFQEIYDPRNLTDADWQAEKNFRLSNKIGTNWRKWILNQNTPTIGADITISGRSGRRTDYYFSLAANRQNGIQENTAANRYTARFNLNTQANDWLKVGVNVGLAYRASRIASYNTTGNSWYNPMHVADWSLPWASVRKVKRDGYTFNGYGDEQVYIEDMGLYNNKLLNKYRPTKDNEIRLNGTLYEQITPIKDLTIKFSQGLEGYDYRYTHKMLYYKYWDEDMEDWDEVFSQNRIIEEFSRFHRLTSSNTAEYKFNITDDHHFIALIGQEAIINESSGIGAAKEGGTDARIWGLQYQPNDYSSSYPYNSFSKYIYNSIFTKLSYDFKERYYLDATWRRDGSSLFGEHKRYANFWSVGAMWDVKKENFLSDVKWIDKLQLFASYGTVGNSGISNYLSFAKVASSTTPYEGVVGRGLSSPGNKDLTWETVESFNVGFDARLFSRLDAKVEYYNRLTKNMLLDIPFSYTTGFSEGTGNVGNMRNRGVEATLKYDIINNRQGMFLSASLNFAYNQDKIVKLFAGRDYFELANTGLRYGVGHSVGEFYQVKFAGIDPANGRELWYDLDGNITGEYSEDYKVYTGKSMYAPWSGGLQLDFIYKNLAVQAQFSGIFGKYMTNNDMYFISNVGVATNQANLAREVLYKTWTHPGQKAKYAAPQYVIAQFLDDRYVENASFVRLKGVTVSYSFGDAVMRKLNGVLSGARVFVTGRNLLTFTKYKGWDPETMTNVSSGRYPNSKEYSIGLELTF